MLTCRRIIHKQTSSSLDSGPTMLQRWKSLIIIVTRLRDDKWSERQEVYRASWSMLSFRPILYTLLDQARSVDGTRLPTIRLISSIVHADHCTSNLAVMNLSVIIVASDCGYGTSKLQDCFTYRFCPPCFSLIARKSCRLKTKRSQKRTAAHVHLLQMFRA